MTAPAKLPDPLVILVRHAAVAKRYHGICYGQSDVELDQAGIAESRSIAGQFAMLHEAKVFHSGLKRTSVLAQYIAQQVGATAVCCPELRERDFGSWELQAWDALHQRHGDAMLKMILEPGSFRPGGGETTFELRDRVVGWFEQLPQSGVKIVVTHGGPIAALLGTQRAWPVTAWPELIPQCGQSVWLARKPTCSAGLSETRLEGHGETLTATD